MIITYGGRGYSPSAIFNQAKRRPELAHAVKTAPRRWWVDATKRFGDLYFCVWFHRDPIDPTEKPPGWVVSGKQWGWQEQHYINRAKSEGFEAHWVPLAPPHVVMSEAAETHGLVCRVCSLVRHEPLPEGPFVCWRCKRAAARAGGMERFLAKELLKEAQRITRLDRQRGK